ncbi:MAG: 3-keto-disaccharide hydrolase [Planctomycetota bacterium]|jgi:hypothetical protein
MKHSRKKFVLAFVATVMMGMPCVAQDVQPPFTWEGEGSGSLLSEGGIEDISFRFELSIDEQGMFKGQASNEEGISRIMHVFCTEPKQYDFPSFFSRKLVVVFLINEYGDNPMLSILNGHVAVDKFIFGEVMLTGYEQGSDTAKALGVGNPEVTLMEDDELPYSLKSALKKCLPIGIVKIEGDYKAVADSGSQGGDTIALFNGRDLEGWHIWLDDADADPKNVWKVQNGTIWCTGKPTGFLRTKEQYSDFKLELEWRWPEKPRNRRDRLNSGVLLRMSGEEKIWPLCMEAQLMSGRAGDFVGMGCNFNENVAKKGGPISYARRMNDSNEKELGGWNKYEITCKGGTIEATINGQLQNKATGVNISKGYIGLQSEGVPIVFRNIKVTPLR